jgi:hypothetical protein
MLKENLTIEDCLELLAGLKTSAKMQIISSDYTILSSIARQVFKGIGLTDKQYSLCKTKLIDSYTAQFLELGIDINIATEKTRLPLRVIDRRKFIRLVTIEDEQFLEDRQLFEYGKNLQWFCIRFPFSKKLISEIDSCITNKRTYYHAKGTHIHYFVANEINVFTVIGTFKENDFDIDKDLFEYYTKIVEVKTNPDNYIPTIENYTLRNVHPRVIKIAEEEIGKLDKETLPFYIDRRRRYGIDRVKTVINSTDLVVQIATRKDVDFLSKPSECDLKRLIESLGRLERYPLLVIVDENHAENQFYDTFNVFRHIVDTKEQSVLFRLSSDLGSSFNAYVKENNLNNWVDKNIKIVYISNEKLPKLLVSGEWKPTAALVFGSFPNRYSDAYIMSYCDLVVYRDESISPFKRIVR